ncbi:NAD(P)-binding domain-containing protein [Mycobacterium neglectum]|jgi:pyrroline-5-carboxylate reductase|uniref:NAD(P)-binding domain-containing protein n=1 Tax=Mycobacterium neglectum TaxID=242737 RepID=UPI000BFEB41A|nr:NAD(P)-binding domain-containing protein [Mycobacterium neglectum]
MSSISIIGVGSMASALASRALAGGNTIEIIGRDPAKAKALAATLGGGTARTRGTAPAGQLPMARALENATLLQLGLITHSVKDTNLFLGVSILS